MNETLYESTKVAANMIEIARQALSLIDKSLIELPSDPQMAVQDIQAALNRYQTTGV